MRAAARTVECPIPDSLLAAVWPPAERAPVPPVSHREMEDDAILAADLRRGLARTQELPAITPREET